MTMKNIFKNNYEYFILILILVIALVFRLYDYANWSLSNDELSALNRLRYDSLREMIINGVMLTDLHPAGVQVFLYYYTKLFGLSVAAIRLPFIIAGVLSVLLTYLIAAKWFNKITGLFAVLSLSFLEFPVLYSQIARPYSPGLLFSLATVWFWTLILFEDKKRLSNYLGFVVSAALAAYTHNYSFLFVLIVGITGLFFLKKDNWKQYILSGVAVFILYIPHIKIFLHQFAIGGVGGEGGWLGKPDNLWFFKYIYYCFNNSIFLLIVFVIIFITSILFNLKNIRWSKFHTLSLIFFFLPFIIGFYYSIFRNPVLQYSILLFSFPFFIIFLFSFIKMNLNYLNTTMLILLAAIGIYNTVFVSDYYNKQHFGEFKDIAKNIAGWNNQYVNKNITYAISVNGPYYIDYYLEQFKTDVHFEQYNNTGGKDLLELKRIVDKSETPYFIYAWTKPCPSEISEIIRTKYPYILEQINYDGLSEITLFSKSNKTGSLKDAEPLFSVYNNFEEKELWGKEIGILDSLNVHSGKYSIKFDSAVEYGPTYSTSLAGISVQCLQNIKICLWAYMKNTSGNTPLVISIESNKGKKNIWAARNMENFININEWCPVFFNYKLPADISEYDKIKIYIWNNSKKEIYVDDIQINFY